MIISRQQIQTLTSYTGNNFPVTSCYLNVDRRQYPQKTYLTALKDMFKQAQPNLANQKFSAEQQKSIEADQQKIVSYLTSEFTDEKSRGIAIFSSSGNNIWQIFLLPRPFPSELIVDARPYIQPLLRLLDEYERYCTVLMDKEKSRIFLVYLGLIEEYTSLSDIIPKNVREPGWAAKSPSHIQRRHLHHVHQHLKHTAEVLWSYYKKEPFDRLIIGGSVEVLTDFERTLHSYLQQRVAGRISLDINAPVKQVLDESLKIEEQIERAAEAKLVAKLLEGFQTRQYCVTGLSDTLLALQEDKVHTLVLSDGFKRSGYKCSHCGYFNIDNGNCSFCSQKMITIPDIIEEAVKLAVKQNCEIEYVVNHPIMPELGNIGAMLRFK
jgi:peptide chain release factor subunit 1